jgi:hypothetical protein
MMSADDNQMPDWMDDEVKRKMKRRAGNKRTGYAIALIVFLVIIIPLACIGAFVPLISWASNSLQDMGDTANEFMLAVRDNQPQAAFDLMTSRYQTQVGHSESLLAHLDGRPEDWSFNSFDINNNSGRISGTVQVNGAERNILIMLFYTGDAWRIDSVNY